MSFSISWRKNFGTIVFLPDVELFAGRSDGLSERRPAHGSARGLRGEEGVFRPYFQLQKYQFFRDPRKGLAFLASDAVL